MTPTMSKRPVHLVLFAVLLIAAVFSFAQPSMAEDRTQVTATDDAHTARMHQRATERLNRALDRIDATDAQRVVFMEIKDELIASSDGLRAQRKAARDTLRSELLSDRPDARSVHAAIDGMSQELTAMAHRAIHTADRAHASLDRKQRLEIADRLDRPLPSEIPWFAEAILEKGLERALDRIDATDEQRTLAEARVSELLKEQGPILRTLNGTRMIVHDALISDSPDIPALHAAVDATSAQLTNLAHALADAVLEFHGTLSQEQLTVIKTRVEEARKRWQRHH